MKCAGFPTKIYHTKKDQKMLGGRFYAVVQTRPPLQHEGWSASCLLLLRSLAEERLQAVLESLGYHRGRQ